MATIASSVAIAAEPKPWQIGLQPAASPTMERLSAFHTGMVWVITLIALFVLGLLVYACWRFRETKNPAPSRTSHNTVLEVLWTAIPVLILIGISIPSFKLLYFADRVEDADMTIKAIGHQWYWSYEYPDNGNFTFDAVMVPEDELKPGQKRLMDTDERVVVPVGKKIRLLITAADVLHSWAVPAFGVKLDAVPGRLNETWVEVTKPGVYYGFCSELCGKDHSFMPIAVEAVPEADFNKWVEEAKKKFARVDEPATTETVKVVQREAGN
jgi:cytochrome c oxidase subunit 2